MLNHLGVGARAAQGEPAGGQVHAMGEQRRREADQAGVGSAVRRAPCAPASAQTAVEAALEHICLRGCQFARVVIADLQAGRDVEAARELSVAERRALLEELVDIMSVYGPVCRVDSSPGQAEQEASGTSSAGPRYSSYRERLRSGAR